MRLGQGHPTIAAQHLIRKVIDSGAATFGIYHDHTTAAVGALADIRAVAGRILAWPLLTIGVESCPPTSTPPTLRRSSAAAHPPSVTNPSPGERLRHTQ